jgi:hypothetical protein
MKCIEVIEIRSNESSRKQLHKELQNIAVEINEKRAGKIVRILSHVSMRSDFRIQLEHESLSVGEGGSQTGLRLAMALKEYGLVNHSVWIEQTEDTLKH